MASLALKLPITRDSADGFTMIKDFQTLIKQNLKMLLLTKRGERVMEPSFGVGLTSYLFSSFTQSTFDDIETNIIKQAAVYLPVIVIKEINFVTEHIDLNTLQISIKYSVPSINVSDLLEFTI
tara:strand:+ start:759 stop:1127 length:369 start_codon:yes stop_codon:yes gene_type:complete